MATRMWHYDNVKLMTTSDLVRVLNEKDQAITSAASRNDDLLAKCERLKRLLQEAYEMIDEAIDDRVPTAQEAAWMVYAKEAMNA